MTFDEWRADFLIMIGYQKEAIMIDLHLGYKKMINKGYDKYKDFADGQLILARNHLYTKINEIEKRLENGYSGT